MRSKEKHVSPNFDRIAAFYRLLELISFGPFLQRARTAHLHELDQASDVLLIGEGNGLFLKALLTVNPKCQVTCLDASEAMLRLSRKRIDKKEQDRVNFQCVDLTKRSLPLNKYDAIVTHFFLDCFNHDTLEILIPKIASTLQPQGKWLLADFKEPARGGVLSRFQRVGLGLLYLFFRASCGIETSVLHSPKEILSANCIREKKCRCYLNGWITSVVYEKKHNEISMGQVTAISPEKPQKNLTPTH